MNRFKGRMMKRLMMALIAGVASMIALPAAAAVKVATYTGLILDGFDSAGFFGAVDSDLTGLAFVSRYTYDTERGFRITDDTSDAIFGNDNDGTSPLIEASLTINGMTKRVGGSRGLAASTTADGFSDHLVSGRQDGAFFSTSDGLSNSAFGAAFPGSLDSDFAQAIVSSTGFFSFFEFDIINDTARGASGTLGYGVGEETYAVGNVPEPAAWTMLIVGFGLTGVALRRKSSSGTRSRFVVS